MKIIIYTKTGCPWCLEVLDYLKNQNLSFEERNMTENPEFTEECQKKSGQTKAPTFDIDGKILADSDVDQLKNFLKKSI